MNEAETRAELIDPALRAAGWGVVADSRTRREVICPGRIEGAGRRGKAEIADYVLTFRNHKLAVIEAKARDKGDTEGVGQAKAYAEKLQTRFAFSTNGRRIYQIDMETGTEGYVERYPTPDELWAEVFKTPNAWRDRFAAVPFEERGGNWEPRYYQHNAIENALEAIATGKQRILLTLATGTGKTAIAFQIAWKLFQSRWNLSRKPERRPRILFLADRNILADQAYNAFSAFPEDALARIKPDEIRKKGRVPKNASVFFTIFQTFMSGTGRGRQARALFRRLSAGLLRFHHHRRVPSRRRQRRKQLARHSRLLRARRAARPDGDAQAPRQRRHLRLFRRAGLHLFAEGGHQRRLPDAVQGEADRHHARRLRLHARRQGDRRRDRGRQALHASRISTASSRSRSASAIASSCSWTRSTSARRRWCSAPRRITRLLVRDLINQMKTSSDPNYCVRVTANDGALGDQWLRTFQDNEKTIPTILTTSQKLSTGVDARNVRNIVLMRPISTMIEFKQIIGRGTRLFDGKDYFTIYDFVKAYEHFNDPEWDGEPMEPVRGQAEASPKQPGCEEEGDGYEPEPPAERPKKIKIRLADGKERTIQHMMATSFWSPDGKPISAKQFVEKLFGELPQLLQGRGRVAAALEPAGHPQGVAGRPRRKGLRRRTAR